MKAAILRAAREPMTIETVELDAPRPEEVRIRVAASGLCHSDSRDRR
jgi:Zn-dependent alcohol dehydrogenase